MTMNALILVLFAIGVHLGATSAFVPTTTKWTTSNNANTAQVKSCLFAIATSSNATATTTPASAFDVLWQADPTVDAPLPPPYTDCPFTGIMAGPKSFYRQASEALNSPTVFSFLHKNQPVVEVRGGTVVREVMRQEFTTLSSNAVAGISQIVCGTESIRTVRDRDEHKALRQLLGVPLAPAAVEKSIPRLEAIGRARIQERIDHIGENQVIKAADMAEAMALDVIWQQILGLDLKTPQEIATFHENTHIWLRGMYYKEGSPQLDACLQAKEYLRDAIDDKINTLLEAGESDGSTVGGFVFATMDDVEDASGAHQDRTLSRQEVIDNSLVMLLAGTETTSTNVANALLLMGLHPDVWQAVIEEQEAIVAQHGDQLSPQVLKACPYLDAVIQEIMRILPLTLVSKRVTEETIVVDGTQIPKGWPVSYNIYLTHEHDESMGEGHMDLLKGFRPDRWLSSETRPGKDYIPFGVGPRQCPGAFLALTEMKVFVSLLAREMPLFELIDMDYDPDLPIEQQIRWNKVSAMITPEDGVRIRVLPK